MDNTLDKEIEIKKYPTNERTNERTNDSTLLV